MFIEGVGHINPEPIYGQQEAASVVFPWVL